MKHALLIVCLAALSLPVIADEFQPLTVRITQSAGSTETGYLYRVETRVPDDKRITRMPAIQLADYCKRISTRSSRLPDRSHHRSETFNCPDSLHDSDITLDYGGPNPGLPTLLAVEFDDNFSVSVALAAHQFSWRIPRQLSAGDVATQYAGLGFKHLLTGFDHLLFVACLLFICLGRWRDLLITITAFTVAHSLTLGLNAFGLISLNVRAVEAIIALSIVYLACDIVRHTLTKGAQAPGLSYRYPATVAAAFGLLHGLGFANILNEFGLPYNDRLLALFSFNVGIELGQLVFIAVILGAGWLLLKLIMPLNSRVAQSITTITSSYLIGVVAMYWTVERIANSV